MNGCSATATARRYDAQEKSTTAPKSTLILKKIRNKRFSAAVVGSGQISQFPCLSGLSSTENSLESAVAPLFSLARHTTRRDVARQVVNSRVRTAIRVARSRTNRLLHGCLIPESASTSLLPFSITPRQPPLSLTPKSVQSSGV